MGKSTRSERPRRRPTGDGGPRDRSRRGGGDGGPRDRSGRGGDDGGPRDGRAGGGEDEGGLAEARMKDRLSDLPEGIIGKIQSSVGLKASIRTSALSHCWENRWMMIETLDLDSTLVTGGVVEHILQSLVRNGITVNSCNLTWPLNFRQPAVIDNIIQLLVQAGTRNLSIVGPVKGRFSYTIPAQQSAYTTPAQLFYTESLMEFEVKFYALPLLDPLFKTSKITLLKLWRVPFSDSGVQLMESLFAVCKNLARIEFRSCDGLRTLKLNSPSLTSVLISTMSPIGISFNGARAMVDASLRLGKHELCPEPNGWVPEDVMGVLKCPLLLENMVLDFALDFPMNFCWSLGRKMPTYVNLRKLDIAIPLNDKNGSELLSALLGSAPAPTQLIIRVKYSAKPTGELDFWYSQIKSNSSLRNLETVTAHIEPGNEHDVSFICYLLASSPVLQRLNIVFTERANKEYKLPLFKKASGDVIIKVYDSQDHEGK